MILRNVVAVALYLLPVLIVLAGRRPRPLWEVALDIPATVAVDLLAILALTRVIPLELSVWIVRVLWLGVGVALARRRGAALGAGDRGAWLVAMLAGALGAIVSMSMSRVYRVWDRYWHIPLAASIGGQTLPFQNVYEPGTVLHYHWTGDVLASTFKALSFHHLSSDVGLVLVHDVTFALIAITVALLLRGLGQKGPWVPILAGAAVVLQGPVPLRGGLGLHLDGYAYHNFVTNSLRPHLGLSGLLMTGFVGAIAVALRVPHEPAAGADAFPRRRLGAILVATTALLAVTDEPSVMMLLASTGVAWLVHPEVLAPTRKSGLLVLLALGAAVVAPNLLFGASLSPGSPVQTVRWVAARVPGAHTEIPVYPMWSHQGNVVILCDFMPFALCAVGLVAAFVAKPSRPRAAACALAWTSIALALVGLTHIEINGLAAVEVQRYFVEPFFAAYLLALPTVREARRGSLATVTIAGGVAVAALSTLVWIREQLPKELGYAEHDKKWMGMMEDSMASDCVRTTGARFGERPRVMYVESSVWYLWIGCNPVFAPGWHERQWTTKTRPTGEGNAIEQLRAIHAGMARPDETIPAACLSDPARSDVVCRRARARGGCERRGELFEMCKLTPEDRRAALGQ